MFLILAYILVNFVFGIIPTYMPILLRDLGYRAALVGVFLALAEGAGIFGPFLFGRFTDRSGNYKGGITFAYFLAAAASLPIAFFVHPAITAVLIMVLFIGFRSITPLVDAMTTINLGEKGDYGKIRTFGTIAYVCIMLFMQWVPVMRPNTSGNIAFWICLICGLPIIVNIVTPSKLLNRKPQKEKLPGEIKSDANVAGVSTETPEKKSIWTPLFILGLTSIGLSRMSMSAVYSFFPLFLVEYMQWDAVGLMYGIASIVEIPFMYFSYRLIRRFGAMPIIAFASAIVALRLGLYAIFPIKAGVISAQLLHGLCFGIFHPAAVAFISGCVPVERRSFGMTLLTCVGYGIPSLIGSFIGGFIVDYAGYRFLFGSFTVFGIMGAAIYVVYRIYGAVKK